MDNRLVGSGGQYPHHLYGHDGNDYLEARGANNDGSPNILDGGAGDDVLVLAHGDPPMLAGGRDLLTGGSGSDRFFFYYQSELGQSTDGYTTITDFEPGIDTIDFSNFMGVDTFVGLLTDLPNPGEVGYFISGGNTIVQAAAAFQFGTIYSTLQLDGVHTLTANDFIL